MKPTIRGVPPIFHTTSIAMAPEVSVVSRKLTLLPPIHINNEFILLSPQPRIITVLSKAGVILYDTTTIATDDIVAWGSFGKNKLITGSLNGSIHVYVISKQNIALESTLPMPEASCRLIDVAADDTRILALMRLDDARYGVFSYENESWDCVVKKIIADDTCRWVHPYGVGGIVVVGHHMIRIFEANNGKKRVIPKAKKAGIITTCAVNDRTVVVGHENGCLLVSQDGMIRRLHWHAHAVSSIAIGNDGSIHSGGDEAVWITWDNVNDRPKQMLPRIAPATIDHLLALDSDKMMIYANNTIHMYDTINSRLIWKYQGVVQTTTKKLQILGSVGENRLALFGSPGNIDVLQDTKIQSSWIVAPYNRVSKSHRGNDIPPPKITCVAQCNDKWLTVHENILEGCPNLVVIQFWDRPNQCVASMVQEEAILTCALHRETAVTVTASEVQFWDNDSSWACRTKVTIPAGFSKHAVTVDPAYSDDGSVVAIAFGRHVTLWNVNTERLLSSILLVEEIYQIEFVMDSLVIRTVSEVACMSVVGNEHWKVDLQATAMGVAGDTVVVGDSEHVVVLDAFTGAIRDKIKHGYGSIVSIHVRLSDDHSVKIHAATENNEVLMIDDSSCAEAAAHSTVQVKPETSNAPTLPTFHDSSRKRRFVEISDLEDWCPSKMVPIEQLADDELPLMRGEFVSAFLGRNLRRKPQE